MASTRVSRTPRVSAGLGLVIVAVSLPLGGCSDVVGVDDPVQGLELRTDRATYEIGDEGVLILTNRYRWKIEHGLSDGCDRTVQRRTESGWESTLVHDPDAPVVCWGGIRSLHPGDTYHWPFEIRGPLFDAPGEYRFVVRALDGAPRGPPPEDPDDFVSPEFEKASPSFFVGPGGGGEP